MALLSMLMLSTVAFSQQNYWSLENSNSSRFNTSFKDIDENNYSVFSLNINSFKQHISGTALKQESRFKTNTLVSFPNEKGKLVEYRIYETPVLSTALSRKYPNIKTYSGFSVDNRGTRIRFSVTPLGVNAMISPVDKRSTFISPMQRNAEGNYIIYNRASGLNESETFKCLTEVSEVAKRSSSALVSSKETSRAANDQNLRTLRMAISTTGEYTRFWDDGDDTNGTAQEDALAQVVSTINRMNEVYEVDMAITFTLVTGTEIIYDTPSNDPYTKPNFDEIFLNEELQATLTEVVGEANYDIGHLFTKSFANGNAGCIGCIGEDEQKGSAFSAHPFTDNDGGPYMTDFFDIDYVCHEVGHQMGAFHTLSAWNEGMGVNFEPGSGSTIMGYAGIMGPDDVQDHTDPYFHYASINQIMDNLDTKLSVGTITVIGNNPPVADAGADYTIPSETPFVLTGAATDADVNDIHTYTWEQIDDGVSHSDNFEPRKRNGAIFRSRPPSASPERYFPTMSRVLSGDLTESNPVETVDNTSWETLTTVRREINFALTVRDRSEGNGPINYGQTSFDTMKVTVDDSQGAFSVTSQETNETWYENSDQLITWNTANTQLTPFNVTQVDILLSTDGGYTYPVTLASNVTNNGEHRIIVPENVVTTQARIMVKPVGNIFFAVNSMNFSISTVPFVLNTTEAYKEVCQPSDEAYTFTYRTSNGFSENTVFSATNIPAGLTVLFDPVSASVDNTSVTMTVSNTENIVEDEYTISVNAIASSYSYSRDIDMKLFSQNINPISLISPTNNVENVSTEVELTWSEHINIKNYLIEIATDDAFTTIIQSETVQNGSYFLEQLEPLTSYYWRVTGSNNCATSAPSEVFSFITENTIDTNFTSTDVPVLIKDDEQVYSVIIIPEIDDVVIKDVNVKINITHTFIGDLYIDVVSPNGTIIDLVPARYDDGTKYSDTVFDDEAIDIIEEDGAAQAPYTGSFIPDGELSDLIGQHSQGEWRLRVWDAFLDDGGTIDNWSLEIEGIAQDFDNDGVDNNLDLCPELANSDQADFDSDGIGDICDDDIDNDGVLNVFDTCNNTPLGSDVDVLGCTIFSLPATNFSLQVTSETCKNSDDGRISISAVESHNYTIVITGEGVNETKTFTNTTEFSDLIAGNYTICITVENEEDYEQCFNVVITEPEDLSVFSRVNKSKGSLSLNLSGSSSYNIELNGSVINTSESEISLSLAEGLNSLRVTTDKYCQGIYKEMINNSLKMMVYPNPIVNSNELYIRTGDTSLKTLDIALYSVIGELIFAKSVKVSNGEVKLDVSTITAGMYLLNVNTGLDQLNYKVLKK